MPRIEMAPIQRSVTSWKCRQSRPAGCSIVQAFWSGNVQRPEIRLSSPRSWLSLTELAVGLTEPSGLRCALAGAAQATINASAIAPTTNRMRVKSVAMVFLLYLLSQLVLTLPIPGRAGIGIRDDAHRRTAARVRNAAYDAMVSR